MSTNPGDNYQIFVMNADGSGRRQVTTDPSVKLQPAWSPDGTRIAYVANSFDVDKETDLEIWTVNADGSGRKQLTDTPLGINYTRPAWSPLGNRIAFVRQSDVYVMNSDGSGEANLTPTSPAGCTECYQNGDNYPAWSPAGRSIAYVHGWSHSDNRFAGGGADNIWVMDDNPTTPDWRNVTNSNSIASSMPAWSPDGTQIAYVRTTDNNSDIWKMNADGNGHDLVETNPKLDINPDWQPLPVCTRTVNTNNDPLVGTAGKDILCGNSSYNMDVLLGIENLSGSNAKDTLTGSASTANVLNGSGGNDVLNVRDGTGGDTANGGTGTDTCRKDAADVQTSCP